MIIYHVFVCVFLGTNMICILFRITKDFILTMMRTRVLHTSGTSLMLKTIQSGELITGKRVCAQMPNQIQLKLYCVNFNR